MRQITTVVAVFALVAFAACKKTEDNNKTPKPKGAPGTAKVAAKAPTEPAPKIDPAVVARGTYLANVLACNVCHTPVGPRGPIMDKAWAGGLKVKEAFGEWVSPNITPHAETGIGKWTDAQIIASIRKGERPDGTKLKPIMPYMFYSQLTDDDAKALVTYMRSLKPIDNKVERVDLKLPHIPAPPMRDLSAKPGEYLATLMHCAACHVPTDNKGMPDMKRAYAGGMEINLPPQLGTGVIYTPNITSDKKTGIGAWTVPQIAASIKAMTRPDGKPIGMPMAMYGAFWSQLTDDDANAVAGFIKKLPPIANKVPPSTFKPASMGPPGGKAPAAAGKGAKDPAKAPTKATKDDMPGRSNK